MEHRQVWKNSLYEPSARVPFIVSGPGVAQGKVITDTITSLLDVCEDIHPTQCIQLRAVLFLVSFFAVTSLALDRPDPGRHGWRHCPFLS